MWQKIKLVVWAAVLAAACYFFLSYHIVFIDNSIRLLRKVKPTSEHTFIRVGNKSMESLMIIDPLRDAGIGEMLVEMGKLSAKEKERLENEYNSDAISH